MMCGEKKAVSVWGGRRAAGYKAPSSACTVSMYEVWIRGV